MEKKPNASRKVIRKWAEERRRELTDTLPTPEQMVAYREGNLEPDAEAALRERLALHPVAAGEFLDLVSFDQLQPPTEQQQVTDADVKDAWKAMQTRIDEVGKEQKAQKSELEAPYVGEPQAEVIPFPAERVRRLRTIARLSAAAALLTLVVGASWIWDLYHRLEEATGPRYAKVIDVATTRSARTHAVSSDVEQIQLVIHGVDLGSFARGLLELSTDDDELLRRREFAASRDEDALLTMVMPRDLLADGTYRIEVFGVDADDRHSLKEYRFGIEESVSTR